MSTTQLVVGDEAPDFTLPSDSGETYTLSALRGKKVIIYFYPKDDTPGCTVEACDFQNRWDNLLEKGIIVLGVSKDSLESHEKFRTKFSLKFPLLSDEGSDMCEKYGVWVKRPNGKFGIERATFLVDENGKLEYIWRNVKAQGHVVDIMSKL